MEFKACILLIHISLSILAAPPTLVTANRDNIGMSVKLGRGIPKGLPKLLKTLFSIGVSSAASFRRPTQRSVPDSARQDRGLQAQAYLNEDLGFATTLDFGSPPQKLNVSIFVNSEFSWLQCLPCSDCTAPVFQAASSKSYTKIPCTTPLCTSSNEVLTSCGNDSFCAYNVSEVTAGEYFKDNISMNSANGVDSFEMGIGCAQDEDSILEYLGTSGIVGFNEGSRSFISQLNGKYQSKFAYCVPSDSDTSTGIFLIGNYKLENSLSFLYTPMLNNTSQFYYVGLEKIGFGQNQIPVQPQSNDTGGTVIDTSTFCTYLLPASFNPLMDAMNTSLQNMSRLAVFNNEYADALGLQLCYNVSGEADLPTTPLVQFEFAGGTKFSVEQNWVIVDYDENDTWNIACVTIGSSEEYGFPFNVIGTSHQFDMGVEFDLVNMRVGFGPQGECGSTMKLLNQTKTSSAGATTRNLLVVFIFLVTIII